MCCSGKHQHHHSADDSSSQKKAPWGGLHLPLMMLCCLLPLASVYFSGASGFGGGLRTALPLLMIALCIVPHLLMKARTPDKAGECCKKDLSGPKAD